MDTGRACSIQRRWLASGDARREHPARRDRRHRRGGDRALETRLNSLTKRKRRVERLCAESSRGRSRAPLWVNLLVFLLLLLFLLGCHGFYSPFQFFWTRNVV